jgi:hypothetical protein
MTLCVAWVRKATQPPELMFATDSRLNTPGRWDVGIKVFELPRQGALIAFHGTASFAHTLIQHLEYDFLQRPEFQSTRQDLHDLAEPICEHFTQLFGEFHDSSTSFLNDVIEVEKANTGFLLGGWSWRQQGHAIWRLNYDPPQRKFICAPVVSVGGNQFAFVGDDWQTAEQQIAEEATTRPLDMQPLRVLHARTYPGDLASSVGGPLQVAKVYASGRVEFFAVAWPTAASEIYRRAARFDQRALRQPIFLDATTGEEVDVLPEQLPIIDNYDWGAEEAFIRHCYPETIEEGKTVFRLRADLRDYERHRLVAALKAVGFERLVQSFNPGHTVASKLLNSQVERMREIASTVDDVDFWLKVDEFLDEPFTEDKPAAAGEADEAPQAGGGNE